MPKYRHTYPYPRTVEALDHRVVQPDEVVETDKDLDAWFERVDEKAPKPQANAAPESKSEETA